ncbi:MAG: ABC transporter ATP-binding protein [Flavobacteriales bacterium]|nr:ABC transporter ATP-binding protein [Flavobacteriales bacterium]MDG1781432.1 ABC transporter ATP-binding protein [Flavobacteriales bacterium]
MLKSSNLTFNYQNGPSFSFPDVACEKEGHLLLLGESGQGKTTLLHLLAGMLVPSSGAITIDGTDIAQLSPTAMDHFRGQHIGIVFQTAHFVQSLSVEDNLILPQYLAGGAVDRSKAKEILTRLNLKHKLQEKTRNLSIGEQQRVAIARALMNTPSIVLADEPTSALDDKNAEEVISLLEEQAALSGAGLVIVTHDQRLKDRFSKRVVL